MNKDIITVTSPLLPNLDEFHELLKDIWDSKWRFGMFSSLWIIQKCVDT